MKRRPRADSPDSYSSDESVHSVSSRLSTSSRVQREVGTAMARASAVLARVRVRVDILLQRVRSSLWEGNPEAEDAVEYAVKVLRKAETLRAQALARPSAKKIVSEFLSQLRAARSAVEGAEHMVGAGPTTFVLSQAKDVSSGREALDMNSVDLYGDESVHFSVSDSGKVVLGLSHSISVGSLRRLLAILRTRVNYLLDINASSGFPQDYATRRLETASGAVAGAESLSNMLEANPMTEALVGALREHTANAIDAVEDASEALRIRHLGAMYGLRLAGNSNTLLGAGDGDLLKAVGSSLGHVSSLREELQSTDRPRDMIAVMAAAVKIVESTQVLRRALLVELLRQGPPENRDNDELSIAVLDLTRQTEQALSDLVVAVQQRTDTLIPSSPGSTQAPVVRLLAQAEGELQELSRDITAGKARKTGDMSISALTALEKDEDSTCTGPRGEEKAAQRMVDIGRALRNLATCSPPVIDLRDATSTLIGIVSSACSCISYARWLPQLDKLPGSASLVSSRTSFTLGSPSSLTLTTVTSTSRGKGSIQRYFTTSGSSMLDMATVIGEITLLLRTLHQVNSPGILRGKYWVEVLPNDMFSHNHPVFGHPKETQAHTSRRLLTLASNLEGIIEKLENTLQTDQMAASAVSNHLASLRENLEDIVSLVRSYFKSGTSGALPSTLEVKLVDAVPRIESAIRRASSTALMAGSTPSSEAFHSTGKASSAKQVFSSAQHDYEAHGVPALDTSMSTFSNSLLNKTRSSAIEGLLSFTELKIAEVESARALAASGLLKGDEADLKKLEERVTVLANMCKHSIAAWKQLAPVFNTTGNAVSCSFLLRSVQQQSARQSIANEFLQGLLKEVEQLRSALQKDTGNTEALKDDFVAVFAAIESFMIMLERTPSMALTSTIRDLLAVCVNLKHVVKKVKEEKGDQRLASEEIAFVISVVDKLLSKRSSLMDTLKSNIASLKDLVGPNGRSVMNNLSKFEVFREVCIRINDEMNRFMSCFSEFIAICGPSEVKEMTVGVSEVVEEVLSFAAQACSHVFHTSIPRLPAAAGPADGNAWLATKRFMQQLEHLVSALPVIPPPALGNVTLLTNVTQGRVECGQRALGLKHLLLESPSFEAEYPHHTASLAVLRDIALESIDLGSWHLETIQATLMARAGVVSITGNKGPKLRPNAALRTLALYIAYAKALGCLDELERGEGAISLPVKESYSYSHDIYTLPHPETEEVDKDKIFLSIVDEEALKLGQHIDRIAGRLMDQARAIAYLTAFHSATPSSNSSFTVNMDAIHSVALESMRLADELVGLLRSPAAKAAAKRVEMPVVSNSIRAFAFVLSALQEVRSDPTIFTSTLNTALTHLRSTGEEWAKVFAMHLKARRHTWSTFLEAYTSAFRMTCSFDVEAVKRDDLLRCLMHPLDVLTYDPDQPGYSASWGIHLDKIRNGLSTCIAMLVPPLCKAPPPILSSVPTFDIVDIPSDEKIRRMFASVKNACNESLRRITTAEASDGVVPLTTLPIAAFMTTCLSNAASALNAISLLDEGLPQYIVTRSVPVRLVRTELLGVAWNLIHAAEASIFQQFDRDEAEAAIDFVLDGDFVSPLKFDSRNNSHMSLKSVSPSLSSRSTGTPGLTSNMSLASISYVRNLRPLSFQERVMNLGEDVRLLKACLRESEDLGLVKRADLSELFKVAFADAEETSKAAAELYDSLKEAGRSDEQIEKELEPLMHQASSAIASAQRLLRTQEVPVLSTADTGGVDASDATFEQHKRAYQDLSEALSIFRKVSSADLRALGAAGA